MIDLHGFKGFATLQSDTSRESNKLYVFTTVNDIPLIRVKAHEACPIEYIPCGSVEWCLKSLGTTITPDYYPDFLEQMLHRKVWKSDEWLLGRRLFVKPADRYKRFTGFVTTGTYTNKKKPPFWYSEVIPNIYNEWRYYVSYGKVLCGEWYANAEGCLDEPLAPELSIVFPSDFCGAVDICDDTMGNLYLVESQHPFACGWYGKDDHLYFQWLVDGWEYMLSQSPFPKGKGLRGDFQE